MENSIIDSQKLLPANQLAALLKVSNALATSLDPGEISQIAIESVTDVLGIETGAIYTLEGENMYLGATTPPLPPDFPDKLRIAKLDDHPYLKTVIETKEHVYIPDSKGVALSPAEQQVVEVRSLVTILFFPLMLKKEAIGAFIIGTSSELHQFSPTEIALCKILSSQAAFALANAKLHNEAQQTLSALSKAYDETLAGWSQMIDLRDHDTDEHTRRVANLTLELANVMDLPRDELIHIRRGALLHDIGKIGIPDCILQKPGALTDDEWAIMKTHPEMAYQILATIDYLQPALDIPYCHHEKWDGTGYPRQLTGEEIPISARIFAVIDVYDALTSNRPYRKAWSAEKTLNYIQEQSGKHFFPDVVDAFLEMVRESSS